MSKKLYICRECGYQFPEQLSELIENNIQVYCERCGSPFVIEGRVFKKLQEPYLKTPKPQYLLSKRKSSKLKKFILFLDKISFLPLFIFVIVNFSLIFGVLFEPANWIEISLGNSLRGIMALIILIYDRAYISPKIKKDEANKIFIDAFCWGILGCVLYGTGVIILIKGIFLIFYVITDSNNKPLKPYNYGLFIKDSLNYFSAKAGFLIIIIAIYTIFIDKLYLPSIERGVFKIGDPAVFETSLLVFILAILLIISLLAILIDATFRSKIKKANQFELSDGVRTLILGITGTIFYAAGIFILLKGLLMMILSSNKPLEVKEVAPLGEKREYRRPSYIEIKDEDRIIPSRIEEEDIKPSIKQPVKIEQQKDIKLELVKIEGEDKEKDKKAKEEDYELKLHESLLPVKEEKDKKLVKQYFSRIFTVLSKDLRQQIKNLKIPKKERKELLEELAFLTQEEQIKYINAIIELYEEIPKKLIQRIRKLPNVKPNHYEKIIDQLKHMDSKEQIKFVQFLEENA